MSVLIRVCWESVLVFNELHCVQGYACALGEQMPGRQLTKNTKRQLTDMKVPGKKNKVTSVMIFMETVSDLVLCATALMSWVRLSILLVDFRDWSARSLFACRFWKSSRPRS